MAEKCASCAYAILPVLLAGKGGGSLKTGRVLDYLGLSPAEGWTLPPPTFRRQADDISALWHRRYERLEAVKREATFAALAGLHGGETIWVCSGRVPVERPPSAAGARFTGDGPGVLRPRAESGALPVR